MKNPPKDGTMIKVWFKLRSKPLVAMWNGANEEWMAAVPEVQMYEGKMNDWYFSNEGFADEELEKWEEM